MRKIIICTCSILMIFCSTVFADESDSGKSWSDLSEVENAWDGQKIIKPEEYDKIINELERKKNAKKLRQEKRAGQTLMKSGSDGSESDFLSKFNEQYPLLNLTVPIKTSAGIVPVGHYKVVGVRVDGKTYINLCQSYNVVGRIPAYETEDDFNEMDINFVKVQDLGNGTLKLMYGSMKFNAYAYMTY